MKKIVIENWFKVVVVALLVIIICRINQIEKNTYYSGELSGINTDRIVNAIEGLKQ